MSNTSSERSSQELVQELHEFIKNPPPEVLARMRKSDEEWFQRLSSGGVRSHCQCIRIGGPPDQRCTCNVYIK